MLELLVSGRPKLFVRHDAAALVCAPFCNFCKVDPFTGAPLNFGETFDASGSPLPKLDTAFHARTSHRTAKRDAATEGAIRLFGLQTP
jgi:hypothetical protein